MLRRFASLTAIFLALTVLAIPGFAQDKGPRPSPSAKAACSFPDGKSITVDYSSPRAKGRKILWRPGSLWRSVAGRSERGHYFRCRHGRIGRRQDRPSRRLHHFHHPE